MALHANTRAAWAGVAEQLGMEPGQLRPLYRRWQRIRRRHRRQRKHTRGW